MFGRLLAQFAALVMLTASSHGAETGIRVALQLERNGQSLAAPVIWMESGKPAEISSDAVFRIKVLSRTDGDKANMQFELYAQQSGSMQLVGTPRLIVQLDKRATVAWTTSDGQAFKLSIQPSLSEKPGL